MTLIVTLTLNPALDVSTSTPALEAGGKLRCAPERRDPGGGGINVARVIHRLGGEAYAVYPAGGAVGEMLKARLEAEHLPGACVPISGATRENFTVIESGTGREFRFVMPGPSLEAEELKACIDAATTKEGEWLVASGGLPPGAPPDIYAALAREARRTGNRLVVDCSGAALREALAEGVYLAKPNLRELEEFTGLDLPTTGRRVSAARTLVRMGAAEVVALTLGADGAILVTADQAWRAEALPLAPMSSVGAGDSFLGAMVWALASGLPMTDAFRYGLAGGAAALMRPGTELCHANDIRRLVKDVGIEAV